MISNLPEQTGAESLKKISGSKHVINATVDFDNLRGICRGTGRLQLRLNNGESADQVKLNFLRLGYQVSENDTDKKRKSVLTGTPNREDREMNPDSRMQRVNDLATQNPDCFGSTQEF